MKKIFGLFAMAALATTGLTCCGGGGGDEGAESHAYRTYTFDAQNTVGAMVVKVQDQVEGVAGRYNAQITFTTGGGSSIYPGYFWVKKTSQRVESENKMTGPDKDIPVVLEATEEVEVGITGNIGQARDGDDGMIMFFSSFVENVNNNDDNDQEINADNPPKPTLYLSYDDESKRGGQYMMSFVLELEDEEENNADAEEEGEGEGEEGEEEEEDKEEKRPKYEATNIGPYGFTVRY